ncbi:MAG: hypothetical protein AAGJ46_00365 [Planctomycetota bacterium]
MDRQAVCPYCNAVLPLESVNATDTPGCCPECGKELPRQLRATPAIDPPSVDSADPAVSGIGLASAGADPLAELRRRLEEAANIASPAETTPAEIETPTGAAAKSADDTIPGFGGAPAPAPPSREPAAEDAPPAEIGALFDKLRSLTPDAAEAPEAQASAAPSVDSDHDSVVDGPIATPTPSSAMGTLMPGGHRLDEEEIAAASTPSALEEDFDIPLEDPAAAAASSLGLSPPADLAADELVASVRRTPAGSARSGWSRLRTVAAVGVGTVIGLAGGYAGLVTLGGPGYDTLGVLALLNAEAEAGATADDDRLPDSPSDELTPPPPFAPAEDSAAQAEAIEPAPELLADLPIETLPAATPEGEAAPSPVEQATFESSEPLAPAPSDTATTDAPTGFPPPANSQEIPGDLVAAMSAPFGAEPPEMTEQPQPQAPIAPPRVLPAGPTYVPAELAQALVGAPEAAATVASNRLADGGALAIGRSYAKLCEVAERMTRLETADAVERTQAIDLFAQLFDHAHVAADTRQVSQRWLAWGDRPHGGVFFAAAPNAGTPAGSVTEYRFQIADGTEVVVLTPEALPNGLGAEMAVIGSVVDSPAEQVEGYTGLANEAIWLGHAISLDGFGAAPRTSALPASPAGK